MIENKEKIILHLCADTGSDSWPYRENGYTVICVGKDIGVENYHPPANVYGIFANPVCTEFSVAQGFDKKADYEKGMFLVRECQRIIKEAGGGGGLLGYRKSGYRTSQRFSRATGNDIRAVALR